MGQELAQAHIDWAHGGDLPRAEADEHLEAAMSVLVKAVRMRPTRWQAPMRIMYSKAAAEVAGTDKKSTYWAARKAVKSLDRSRETGS